MYLLLLLALLAQSHVSQAAPLHQQRDVDFESFHGLTKATRDWSGKGGDPSGKYFHEATFNPHYDGRFASDILPYHTRQTHLTHLLRSYLTFMENIKMETWIMHGSLLGWFWNRKILPWDSDIDVQVSESSIAFLAAYHNMTVHHFTIPGLKAGRNYLLEINPNFRDGSDGDIHNVIDARWIDMDSGLFIDITTLRRDIDTEEVLGITGQMKCKDRHHYARDDIFPLRESVFEGAPVKVPYAYSGVLAEEYGTSALTLRVFEGHRFDDKSMEWVPMFDPKHSAQVSIFPVPGRNHADVRSIPPADGNRPLRGGKPHRSGEDTQFAPQRPLPPS